MTTHATHDIQNLIDEHQTDLSDNLYKILCDKLAKIHCNNDTAMVRFFGVMITNSIRYDEDGDAGIATTTLPVHITTKVSSSDNGWNLKKDHICSEFYFKIKSGIEHNGYYRDSYHDNGDTFFIINKYEKITE